MLPDNLLNTLKQKSQWVLWKYETRDKRRTKVPYQFTGYKAASDRPETWTTYEQAIKAAPRFDGIGVMFAGGLCGLDLDHHSDTQNDYIEADGRPTIAALEWISQIDTYWEISPSGAGLHALCFGSLPVGKRQDDKQGIAFYDVHRFFTVTGRHVSETALDVKDCSESLPIMYHWLFGNQVAVASTSQLNLSAELPTIELDARIIALVCNDQRHERLWRGDFTDYQGDCSRADLALAARVLYLTSDHILWADRILRQWPGFRADKWDARHFANGDTYGRHTLIMAAHHGETIEHPPIGAAPRPALPVQEGRRSINIFSGQMKSNYWGAK